MAQNSTTKISDSKSWTFYIRHFTRQNCLGEIQREDQSNNNKKRQTQYVTASTLDNWFSLRSIDVKSIKWEKIIDLKMAMPVINSFIQFNWKYQPVGLVVAYFDGSVEYSPWESIQQYYAPEIEAAKKRQSLKTWIQTIQTSPRSVYINTINDESQNIEEAFMLETICFLHKKEDFIYLANYKGQIKVLKFQKNNRKLKQVNLIKFNNKITQAQCLINYHQLSVQSKNSIVLAICFEGYTTPYVFEISPNSLQTEILSKFEYLNVINMENDQILNRQNVKLMTFDTQSKQLIVCTEKNQIAIFSFDREKANQKESVIVSNLEKIFTIDKKIDCINDISISNGKILVMCTKSFYFYDIEEGILMKDPQKLKELLHFGKLVTYCSSKERPLLLIKKKFNYLDLKQKTSTTLHLFLSK